ncbi:MAG TPA: MFS transporter [Anaerolineales bacterium]|nr:MFS transporter [Anaerolineales bacterium]
MKRLTPFILTLLLIEFLDELVFGAREAAWPLVRDDLGLTYVEIGLLLAIPGFLANFIEPVIGVLGDVWKRRVLVLGGGIFFAGALLLTAFSQNFWVLLLSFVIFYPSSGAFVSLSQAALMDEEPDRHEQNMARWTFAGSLGVVAGPLALGAAIWLNLGWRGLYAVFGGLTLLLVVYAARYRFPAKSPVPKESDEVPSPGFRQGLRLAFRALKRREVLRWLVLLEFSDLMLDILLGFLALYLVDIAGGTPAQAGIGVAVWSGFGLLGDFLLIPLLERVKGLDYLRVSVIVEMILYPLFLLMPGYWIKLVILGLMGLFNAGWYAILKGQLYASMPGQSGTVMTLGSVSGLVGQLIPLGVGMFAQWLGLGWAMWVMLLGPVALLVGIPGRIKP